MSEGDLFSTAHTIKNEPFYIIEHESDSIHPLCLTIHLNKSDTSANPLVSFAPLRGKKTQLWVRDETRIYPFLFSDKYYEIYYSSKFTDGNKGKVIKCLKGMNIISKDNEGAPSIIYKSDSTFIKNIENIPSNFKPSASSYIFGTKNSGRSNNDHYYDVRHKRDYNREVVEKFTEVDTNNNYQKFKTLIVVDKPIGDLSLEEQELFKFNSKNFKIYLNSEDEVLGIYKGTGSNIFNKDYNFIIKDKSGKNLGLHFINDRDLLSKYFLTEELNSNNIHYPIFKLKRDSSYVKFFASRINYRKSGNNSNKYYVQDWLLEDHYKIAYALLKQNNIPSTNDPRNLRITSDGSIGNFNYSNFKKLVDLFKGKISIQNKSVPLCTDIYNTNGIFYNRFCNNLIGIETNDTNPLLNIDRFRNDVIRYGDFLSLKVKENNRKVKINYDGDIPYLNISDKIKDDQPYNDMFWICDPNFILLNSDVHVLENIEENTNKNLSLSYLISFDGFNNNNKSGGREFDTNYLHNLFNQILDLSPPVEYSLLRNKGGSNKVLSNLPTNSSNIPGLLPNKSEYYPMNSGNGIHIYTSTYRRVFPEAILISAGIYDYIRLEKEQEYYLYTSDGRTYSGQTSGPGGKLSDVRKPMNVFNINALYVPEGMCVILYPDRWCQGQVVIGNGTISSRQYDNIKVTIMGPRFITEYEFSNLVEIQLNKPEDLNSALRDIHYENEYDEYRRIKVEDQPKHRIRSLRVNYVPCAVFPVHFVKSKPMTGSEIVKKLTDSTKRREYLEKYHPNKVAYYNESGGLLIKSGYHFITFEAKANYASGVKDLLIVKVNQKTLMIREITDNKKFEKYAVKLLGNEDIKSIEFIYLPRIGGGKGITIKTNSFKINGKLGDFTNGYFKELEDTYAILNYEKWPDEIRNIKNGKFNYPGRYKINIGSYYSNVNCLYNAEDPLCNIFWNKVVGTSDKKDYIRLFENEHKSKLEPDNYIFTPNIVKKIEYNRKYYYNELNDICLIENACTSRNDFKRVLRQCLENGLLPPYGPLRLATSGTASLTTNTKDLISAMTCTDYSFREKKLNKTISNRLEDIENAIVDLDDTLASKEFIQNITCNNNIELNVSNSKNVLVNQNIINENTCNTENFVPLQTKNEKKKLKEQITFINNSGNKSLKNIEDRYTSQKIIKKLIKDRMDEDKVLKQELLLEKEKDIINDENTKVKENFSVTVQVNKEKAEPIGLKGNNKCLLCYLLIAVILFIAYQIFKKKGKGLKRLRVIKK